MEIYFIVNPISGRGKNEDLLREEIRKAGIEAQIYVTKDKGDAAEFAKRVITEYPDTELRLIACGGDGTINEVFSAAVKKANVSVGIYPCGSGNDLVKSLGGKERFQNVRQLVNAAVRPIDILKVGDRYSVNVVNFGFDAAVCEYVEKHRTRKGYASKTAYLKGVVSAMVRAMKNRFTVIADGEVLNPDGTGLLCTLANGQYVGSAFHCAPRAKLDDGIIEVCYIQCISRWKLLQLVGSYIKGSHLDDPRVWPVMEYRQARKVEVNAPEGFIYTLDGELIHENSLTVEVIPRALYLAVPEE